MQIAETDHAALSARKQQYQTALKGVDLTEKGAAVIVERLHSNPKDYLSFGAYWWAVKELLRRQGTDFGNEDDARVREAYAAKDDETLLVAAEAYREAYFAHYFVGNRDFTLANGQAYTLYDADMEMLIAVMAV